MSPTTRPLTRPGHLGIYARALLLVGFVLVVAMAAVTFWIIQTESDQLTRALERRIVTLAGHQAAAVVHPLWDLNRDATHTVLQGLAQDPDFVSAEVVDERGQRFATVHTKEVPQGLTLSHVVDIVLDESGGEQVIGRLTLTLSRERLSASLGQSRSNALLVGIILLVTMLLAIALVLRMLLNPLAAISDRMLAVSRGDLRSPVPYADRVDQIGELARAVDAFRVATEEREETQAALRRAHDEMEQRAEQRTAELQQTESLFRSVIVAMPAEFFVRDNEGRMLLVNRAWEEAQGVREKDAVGKTNWELLPPERAARYAKQDEAVLSTGQSLDVLLEQPFGDEIRTFHTIKFPLFDNDGAITGIGGITTDVTESRRSEERLRQAQKMEAVGQLTGGVAHDFNNLLAVIQGNAELLAASIGRDQRYLQPILQASRRGGELTQRLLAFSRQQSLASRVIDLGELVSGVLELLARTLGETIEIQTVVARGLWTASADPGQVENALLNLAINARDAMPEGGKLTIECTNARLGETYVAKNPETETGEYVVLAITDEGSGMSPDVQAHAFEPFFTSKDVGKGSGLGLSMVYGFAKQSGGHVTIYSEVGLGTTVKLYLPRAMPGTFRADVAEDEELEPGAGESIMVVEDDPEVRAMAASMLEGLGYAVLDVPDAAGARAALARGERVDLVLSDVVLPGGTSGPELAEQIRGAYPRLRFLFMSGYPADAARRNGFLGSGKVLLNKPFRRRELARAVRKALDG